MRSGDQRLNHVWKRKNAKTAMGEGRMPMWGAGSTKWRILGIPVGMAGRGAGDLVSKPHWRCPSLKAGKQQSFKGAVPRAD